jgi:hypothetical protein
MISSENVFAHNMLVELNQSVRISQPQHCEKNFHSGILGSVYKSSSWAKQLDFPYCDYKIDAV